MLTRDRNTSPLPTRNMKACYSSCALSDHTLRCGQWPFSLRYSGPVMNVHGSGSSGNESQQEKVRGDAYDRAAGNRCRPLQTDLNSLLKNSFWQKSTSIQSGLPRVKILEIGLFHRTVKRVVVIEL